MENASIVVLCPVSVFCAAQPLSDSVQGETVKAGLCRTECKHKTSQQHLCLISKTLRDILCLLTVSTLKAGRRNPSAEI